MKNKTKKIPEPIKLSTKKGAGSPVGSQMKKSASKPAGASENSAVVPTSLKVRDQDLGRAGGFYPAAPDAGMDAPGTYY